MALKNIILHSKHVLSKNTGISGREYVIQHLIYKTKCVTILIHVRGTHSCEVVISKRSMNSTCNLSPAGAMMIHSHSVCGGGTLG